MSIASALGWTAGILLLATVGVCTVVGDKPRGRYRALKAVAWATFALAIASGIAAAWASALL